MIGLPTGLSGREGPQAAAVRRFADRVREATGRTVRFHDERLTSFMAEQTIAESGSKTRRRKKHIDDVAAAFILQSYLDATRG